MANGNTGGTPPIPYNEERMNRMNISSIETFFDRILRGTLTDHLFFNELPPSIRDDWYDIVVVDCGNPLRDSDAFSVGTVLIYLYAKQDPYGNKSVKVLQDLEKRLNHIILENNDEHYHISRRGNYSNYNAVNDIYLNIIQINLIIS